MAIAALLLTTLPVLPADDDADGLEFYENRIRPLLAEHCVDCHGPDRQRSELRLDSRAGALRGGERGPALVPGEPDASRMIQAVRRTDAHLSMPPKTALEPAAVGLLVDWVRRGAPGPDEEAGAIETGFDFEARLAHWSWQPPRASEAPALESDGWVRDVYDRYVLARAEAAGLSPAADAPRSALARRLSFDLTGLPPTPEELALLEGDSSEAALEAYVDGLLASPHFAERWARHWLDLARYAESRGHEFDYDIANAWQFRDWVVRAFDADVPYDRFVAEQIAGDLLETPRPNIDAGWDEAPLGTGFWLLGEEVHSPVDIRGDECERRANQLDTFGKTFLGLTVACARCHDHKFDAIRRRDYYSLQGHLLSSQARLLRFETDAHNRALAQELADVDAEHEPVLRAALGELLARELADLEGYIALAQESGAIARAPWPSDEPLPAGMDLLFEDFDAALPAGWQAEGQAFAFGPLGAEEVPGGRGAAARGAGAVHSHHRRQPIEGSPDQWTGSLRSPAFTIERDWIHLLITGGNHAQEVGVRLLVEDEELARLSGRNENRYRPARFDVRAQRGKRARIEVYDQRTGGWGIIGVDHIVFSDEGDERALELMRRPAEQAAHLRALRGAAGERGLDPERALAWCALVERGGLERLAQLAGSPREPASSEVRWLWSAADPDAPWLVNGPGFGAGVRAAGQIVLGPSPEQPLGAVAPWASAHTEPAFDGLRVRGGSVAREAGLRWAQAGRTLHTPEFAFESGVLWYLVRGRGHAIASVDAHRMVHGPLHGRILMDFDTGAEGWRWVRHDLGRYGAAADDGPHHAHVELTPREGESLWVAAVAESPHTPWSAGGAGGAGAEAWAEFLLDAARSLPAGEARGPEARALSWLFGQPELVPGLAQAASVRDAWQAWSDARAPFVAAVQAESRLAPALLEASGFDEQDLVRGDPRSPAGQVERRFLEALGGLEGEGPGSGSGRLELARRVTAPDNPLTARVWVNRVWHHLHGAGLVRSVDDLGDMGTRPTHPELLDRLALDFVADGWSTKRLIRRLVLTSTYRQDSAPSAAALEGDPANDWLSHARVARLEGEAVRDAVLAVSGRLDPTVGGESIAIHLTPFLQGRGRPGSSGPVDGAGRRSLYLAVRRNFVVPLLSVFDFPAPISTRGRRSVSNVPAQALALLNSPFVHAEARRFAERALAEEPDDEAARLTRMYRLAFGRDPSAEERAISAAYLEQEGAARGLARESVDLWQDVAHALYNAKEFVWIP